MFKIPRATPIPNPKSEPRSKETTKEKTKLIEKVTKKTIFDNLDVSIIKFELNYNNTKILIESDNEETLNDVLDVIKDTCGEQAPIRKLLEKEN